MVKVTRGKNWKGEPCNFYIDGFLKTNLDGVINMVTNKNWDYVCIVAGIPGAGKSNFAQSGAKYCDPNFNIKNIVFSADDFIKKTNEAEEFSAIILDESFASLNTRISNNANFMKIINHLQLIRQKHLFIFLCLPNFFDLSKGVALYRSSHLFFVYADEEGNRGRFTAFDREKKRLLYVKGQKFMDYSVVKSNFFGTFTEQKAIDWEAYEELKMNHLKEQELYVKKTTVLQKITVQRNKSIVKMYENKIMNQAQIARFLDMTKQHIGHIINTNLNEPFV